MSPNPDSDWNQIVEASAEREAHEAQLRLERERHTQAEQEARAREEEARAREAATAGLLQEQHARNKMLEANLYEAQVSWAEPLGMKA